MSLYQFDEEWERDDPKFREELRGVIDHGYNPYTKHGESVSGSYDRLNKLSKINSIMGDTQSFTD